MKYMLIKSISNMLIKSSHITYVITDDENALYRKFHDCYTVDDQLAILKEYLNDRNELPVNFIAQIFLQAEAKNPVKCYIARYDRLY